MDPLDAMELMTEWPVGTEVIKTKGYRFPGIVRAVFTNGEGDVRVVVEHRIVNGLLHIFSTTQLEKVENPYPCSTPGCPGDGRYFPPGRGHVIGCGHDG